MRDQGEFKCLPDTAECCIGCNKACISNQVTVRPPRRRLSPPPSRGKAGNELESPAISRIAASGTRLRCSWPAYVGDPDADDVVRCLDRDRDRLAGGTRAAVPDTVDEKLVHEQGGYVPARVLRAEHPVHERAGDPRPLCPPRKRHCLPDCPSHQRNRPSCPHRPGEVSGPPGGRTRGCTLNSAAPVKPGHAAGAARPWPSVETPTVHTDRPDSTDARPLCVREHRNTTVYSATS